VSIWDASAVAAIFVVIKGRYIVRRIDSGHVRRSSVRVALVATSTSATQDDDANDDEDDEDDECDDHDTYDQYHVHWRLVAHTRAEIRLVSYCHLQQPPRCIHGNLLATASRINHGLYSITESTAKRRQDHSIATRIND